MTLMNFVAFMLTRVDQTLVIKNQEWFSSSRKSGQVDTITLNSFVYITLKIENNIQVGLVFFLRFIYLLERERERESGGRA